MNSVGSPGTLSVHGAVLSDTDIERDIKWVRSKIPPNYLPKNFFNELVKFSHQITPQGGKPPQAAEANRVSISELQPCVQKMTDLLD